MNKKMNKASLQSLKRKLSGKTGKSPRTPSSLGPDTPGTAVTLLQSNTTLSVEHEGMPNLPLENDDLEDSIAGLSSVSDDNEEHSRHDSFDDDSYYRQDDYFAMAQSAARKSHTAERSKSPVIPTENVDVDRSIISMTSTHSIDVGSKGKHVHKQVSDSSDKVDVNLLDLNLEPQKDYRSHFRQLLMSKTEGLKDDVTSVRSLESVQGDGRDAAHDTARPVTPSLSSPDLTDEIQPKTPDAAAQATDHLQSMSPESKLRTVRDSLSELMALGPSFDAIYASSPAYSAEDNVDTGRIRSDNKKLRKGQRNLLKLLSSSAKQFSVYEEMMVQRIHDLEEKNRLLLAGPNDADSKLFGPEVVRRPSGNARDQESKLEEKEVKCGTPNETIFESSVEGHDRDKKLNCESSPTDGLLALKRKCSKSNYDLDKALADVSTLTAKLENSNQALDESLNEVNELKQWKTKHVAQLLKYKQDSAKSLEVEKDKLRKEYEAKIEEALEAEKIEEERRAVERLAAEEQLNIEQTLELERLRDAHAASEARVESLRSDVAARNVEATQLQKDLERSLNEIEDLKRSINEAGAAKGYADFQLVVEEWKDKAVVSEKKAVELRGLVAQLSEQLESKNGEVGELRLATEAQNAEIEKMRVITEIVCRNEGARQTIDDSEPAGSKAHESPILNIANSLSDDGGENTMSSPSNRRQVLGRLKNVRDMINVKIESRRGAAVDMDEGDLENRIRLRDKKISSLQNTINLNTKMVERLTNNVESLDQQLEEVKFVSNQQIEQLTQENMALRKKIEGFESTFVNMNGGQRQDLVKTAPSTLAEKHIWDAEKHNNSDQVENVEELHRIIAELRSRGSKQEDDIESIKAELTRVKFMTNQEKELAVQKAVRADLEEKLAPLMEKMDILEEEKRSMDEETNAKIACREQTISNLEQSLIELRTQLSQQQQLGQAKKKSPDTIAMALGLS